jgi:hypothetical protein
VTTDFRSAWLYANLSAAAYESNLEHLKTGLDQFDYDLVDFFGDPRTDTHGYVAVSLATNRLVVAFRGTDSIRDFEVDGDVVPVPDVGLPGCPDVHRGFLDAYLSVEKDLVAILVAQRATYPHLVPVFTGHSLGGALAHLAAAHFFMDHPLDPLLVYTYGSPRVGWSGFAKWYSKHITLSYRVVHERDLVPRVPLPPFLHTDTELHITDDGKVIGSLRLWWRRLLDWDRQVIADFDGEGLREHYISGYLTALQKCLEVAEKTAS